MIYQQQQQHHQQEQLSGSTTNWEGAGPLSFPQPTYHGSIVDSVHSNSDSLDKKNKHVGCKMGISSDFIRTPCRSGVHGDVDDDVDGRGPARSNPFAMARDSVAGTRAGGAASPDTPRARGTVDLDERQQIS
jgi:hypothetical protein